MSQEPEACSLSLTTAANVQRVREVLDRAGYSETRVQELLGVAEIPPWRLRRRSLALYRHRTRGGGPLDTLVRIFLLHEPVAVDAARAAVAPLALEELFAIGLIRIEQDRATATMELFPYQGLVIAADWPGRSGADRDQVMGVSASSRTLAQMTIRRPVRRTLDLGTGSGVLAFLAAAHSDEVVGVDRNPRALHVAAFNAQLNQRTRVTFREGDLFDPVHYEKFDLIVCNPPFVIGPLFRALHSHGGLPSDDLCRNIVRSAPAFLEDGGFCQLLLNWACMAGQDWRERVAGWFAGIGCDAWALLFRTQDAAGYAAERVAEMAEESEAAARLCDEWIQYFTGERIEAIGFGLITLRRSARMHQWTRCDAAPDVRGACGESIARGFEARDFLEAHAEDGKLLEARLRPAPDLRWEQQRELGAGGWIVRESQLRLTQGLAYAGNFDAPVADFLQRCRDARPLRDHLAEAARSAGRPAEQLAPAFLRVVRRLIEIGCFVPFEVT